jgi:hypothetical protein
MKILTANRLTDGAVVWLGLGGRWSAEFEDAVRLEPEAAARALAAAEAQPGRFVGAYLIEADAAGVERRERLRESIRADGPTAGHSLENA